MVQKIFLLSGGLDSSVALLKEFKENKLSSENCDCLFFDRRSNIEGGLDHRNYECEKKAAQLVIDKIFGPSKKSLNIIKLAMDWYARAKIVNKKAYPFGRNVLLASAAASYAAINYPNTESEIIVGFNKGDTIGDTSEEFINQFNTLCQVIYGKTKISVKAPLKKMEKAEIITYVNIQGSLGIDILKNSWSCYENGLVNKNHHCGICGACVTRKDGFKKSGVKDPTIYNK